MLQLLAAHVLMLTGCRYWWRAVTFQVKKFSGADEGQIRGILVRTSALSTWHTVQPSTWHTAHSAHPQHPHGMQCLACHASTSRGTYTPPGCFGGPSLSVYLLAFAAPLVSVGVERMRVNALFSIPEN